MIASGGSYYNVASGTILPAGYQQVEYIESNGNQYIETNFIADQDTSINIRFKLKSIANLTESDGSCIYSGAASYNNRTKEIFSNANKLSINCGNAYIYSSLTINTTNIFEIENTKNIYVVKNINTSTSSTVEHTYTTYTTPYSIWLFALHRGNSMSSIKGKGALIYKCSIKDNNTLVRNFIPCYRISDNEIGMYDTVNGVFYTNQGTGTFLKGNNVVHTIRYKIPTEERPYISGHVTDGSSTFTFKINGNTNINVLVDSDGNWKWYQDRAITSLNRMICFTSTTYTDNIDYLEINANLDNCTNLGVAIALSTLEKVVIKSKTALLTDISYLAQDCVNLKQFYAPNINLGTGSNVGSMFLRCANLEIVDLRNSKIVTAGATSMFSGCDKLNTLLVDSIKANTKFASSNVLPKQFVINIINVAQANVIYTLHSTVYAKCASGGEWYTDIQAAINAKSQQGYTVTLISA